MLPACLINASNGIWREKTNPVETPKRIQKIAHLDTMPNAAPLVARGATNRVSSSETEREKFMAVEHRKNAMQRPNKRLHDFQSLQMIGAHRRTSARSAMRNVLHVMRDAHRVIFVDQKEKSIMDVARQSMFRVM
jgi:hypothetical protein